MPLDRDAINSSATQSDLEELAIRYDSIDEQACALLGFQRTKQISKAARTAWENGDTSIVLAEVKAHKARIISGAFLEIYQEYLPLRDALAGRAISSVCDIGCGQGINNVYLNLDFQPSFTLVDIEQTDDQYHLWASDGSGYASLAAAKALLLRNGVDPDRVTTINPKKTKADITGQKFDLVTSLYSCGFHYPIDDYLQLFIETVENDGLVCLDMRRRYLRRGSSALEAFMSVSRATEIYEDARSFRLLFSKA